MPRRLQVGSRCLPRVLGALVRPGTVALYCHTKHRFDLLDWEFFAELEACGLQCEEVGEAGGRRGRPKHAATSGRRPCKRRCMGRKRAGRAFGAVGSAALRP